MHVDTEGGFVLRNPPADDSRPKTPLPPPLNLDIVHRRRDAENRREAAQAAASKPPKQQQAYAKTQQNFFVGADLLQAHGADVESRVSKSKKKKKKKKNKRGVEEDRQSQIGNMLYHKNESMEPEVSAGEEEEEEYNRQ